VPFRLGILGAEIGMPLRARLNEKDIFSYEFDENAWNQLKASYKQETLMMPCCDNKAIPKISKLNNYFFAHARRSGCTSAPETFEHIFLKTLIAKIARSLGWDVTTEKIGETPEGERWIADVFCIKGKAKIAIEIQWSPQTETEFRRRQEKYIASGVRTAWLYKLRRNQDYLPALYEIPAFGIQIKSDSGEMDVPQFDLPIDKFVRGMLEGKLKWRPEQNEKLIGKLITDHNQCWRCKRKTKVILGIGIYDKEGINLSHLYFHDNEISVPKFILQHLNNSELGKNNIAPIKPRYSNTMQEAYLSNGCFHCDAIQGQWFLYDAWVDAVYAESSQTIMDFSFINGYNNFRVEGKWYFGKEPSRSFR